MKKFLTGIAVGRLAFKVVSSVWSTEVLAECNTETYSIS